MKNVIAEPTFHNHDPDKPTHIKTVLKSYRLNTYVLINIIEKTKKKKTSIIDFLNQQIDKFKKQKIPVLTFEILF